MLGVGAVPPRIKADEAFVQDMLARPANEPLRVYITLMTEDPVGEWRQALVDALAQTYGATTQNRDDIAALTADVDDGAEADGAITANRKAIEELTADTDDGAEADGAITANRKAIEDLTADTDDGAGLGVGVKLWGTRQAARPCTYRVSR